ncbi:hypothetical protein F4810DRAFT_40631 [Camillea tinctor]|nr:hypothetical protein F4810DRAFT_40631 [Camillea tinctor]
MAGQLRTATPRAASVDPVEGYVTRQTRQASRRITATEPKMRPQHEIARRGTARQARRPSTEALATDDSPQSSIRDATARPDRSSIGPTSEPVEPQHPASDSDADTDGSDETPEARAARIRDMVDFDIPKFSRWNQSMYDVLASLDGPPSSSSDRKRLASIRKAYDAARRPLVEEDQLFIDLSTLAEDCSPEVHSVVRKSTSIGNLVALLVSILDIRRGKKNSLPFLQKLDDAFPALFEHNFQPDSDSIDEDIFDLAFSIRCCRLALSLAANPGSNPFIVAAGIFCSQPTNRTKKARQVLIEGPFKELAGINLNEQDMDLHDTYQAQMGGLVSKLSLSDKSKVVETLNREYSEMSLLEILWSWAGEKFESFRLAEQRASQSPQQAEQANSSEEHEPEDGLFVTGSDDPESDTDTEEYDQLVPQGSDDGFIDNSAALAAVKQIEREAEKGKQIAVTTRDAIRLLDPRKVLSSSHPERLQSNLHNQDDLRQFPSGSRLASPIGTMQTRQHSVEDDALSDDDFEVNEQLVNESKRVRYQDTIQRLPSKRSRVSSGHHQGSPSSSSPSRATRRREPSKQLTNGDPFLDGDDLGEADIMALSQAAQDNRRSNNGYRPRQTRTPWSIADTDRLLDLIADPSLNCSWASMERRGGFEKYQTQQSLRDKARNLKVLYLQSGTVLPAGFDQVALGTKERDAVIRSGRNPDRTEGDLDEHGRVINDIWTPR